MGNDTEHNHKSWGEKKAELHVILLCSVVLILAAIIVAGNSLVIASVISNRRLQTKTSAFITSLAVCDLIIGLVLMPLIVVSNTVGPAVQNGLDYCHVTISVAVMLMFNSVANLGAVTFDRFLAVVVPLRYKSIMTKRVIVPIIVFVWIFSTVFGFIPFMGWRAVVEPEPGSGLFCQVPLNLAAGYIITVCVVGFLPSIFVLVAYLKIFQTAYLHEVRIAAAINSVLRNQTEVKLNMIKEMKAAKMVALVLGAFIFSWAPLFVIMIVDIAMKNAVNSYIYAGGVIFATLNSALNPVIYASMNSEFRDTFKALIQCQNVNAHRIAPGPS
ncbi:octopamine receptor 1-like [Stylophora pistillata]|uniref:octopamine receptor 1-like n=1 Tax=Stylophora pistillata TaxID=50429 RepID=UPI000C04D8E0|nr:octopamine receptor 1-like [Stylophora pistillata]XP_022802299.1 octopamine receptor 1-like [Stylophora pistillata]XP_022802368.1 octopamine receptor 1-like [Stylophora pistillata]